MKPMPVKFTLAFAALVLLSGCNGGSSSRPSATQVVSTAPFSLAIVPPSGSIWMARNNPGEFYVLLSNTSDKPQTVFQNGNSWGYQAVSFVMTANGTTFFIRPRIHGWTWNFPSTFVIAPGEHQIYAIRLDEWWEAHPSISKADELPISLKAVYEVDTTPESAQFKVWTGRVESHFYDFTLKQF